MTSMPEAITDPLPGSPSPDDPPMRPAFSRRPLLIAAGLALLLAGVAIGVVITPVPVRHADTPSVGSVDVGFAQDMQVHETQAVTMATLVRERTTDPVIKTFAFGIEGSLLSQTGTLTGWLDLWGQPKFPDPGTSRTWLPDAGHTGIATPDELTRLRSLTGRDLDISFLQLMIRHHQGGLPLARYAAQHATQAAVRNLADKIVESQTDEINVMTQLLTQNGAQPLPAPN